MNLAQALERARDKYVSALSAHARARRETFAKVATELLIRPNGSNAPAPFDLIRVDIIYEVGGQTKLERIQPQWLPLESVTMATQDDGVQIECHAVAWDNCRLDLDKPTPVYEVLDSWWRSWLNADDDRASGADGLKGVVHSLAVVAPSEGSSLIVDFGSAKPHAFYELVSVLSSAGVRRIRITDASSGA